MLSKQSRGATAIAVLVAAAFPAAALAASAETKVTIRADGGDFSGKVKSDKLKCVDERKVTVYRLKGGGDPDPKNDRKIASDTASLNGDHGEWSTGNTGVEKGKYYAHARKIDGCKPGTSKVVRVEELENGLL
jgi:hypothetical protein